MLTHTPSGLWAVVPLMLFDWLRAAPTHTILHALWPCAVECRLPPCAWLRWSVPCCATVHDGVNLLFPAFR